MVSPILPPDGSPMSMTYLVLHIVFTALYGVGALGSLFGVWVIASETREKNKSNEIMDHDHYKTAPMWMSFVLSAILCILFFISYCFDGTIFTALGHEPPQFGDNCGRGNYYYEILWFINAFAVIGVSTGIQCFRHCITVGVTSGLMAIATLLSALVVILRFQVKSNAFYGVSYTFAILIYLMITVLIVMMSNLTVTKGIFARVGGLMGFCIFGFLAYIALDMTFGFWQCIWEAYQSAILQTCCAFAFAVIVSVVATSSQSKNIDALIKRGEMGISSAINNVTGSPVAL